MIRVYNVFEQARNILRQLRLANPGVTLPGGIYAMPDRELERVCKFLETELEGAMADCAVDPSGGAGRPDEAPDGKV